MSLSATVTKKSVITNQAKIFSINFNLKVLDGAVEAINQDVSIEYRTGDSIASKVNDAIAKMQPLIDNYKSAQVIFNNAQLDTAVGNIQGGLSL